MSFIDEKPYVASNGNRFTAEQARLITEPLLYDPRHNERRELADIIAAHEIDDYWDCRSGCDVHPGEFCNDREAQAAHLAEIIVAMGYTRTRN